MAWLSETHPELSAWYQENRRPRFDGVKNAGYYIGHIRRLGEHVPEKEFIRIVGVKFADYLGGVV